MKDRKIIIVEDQPIVALDFQTYLNANGYGSTSYFSSGKKAMKNIKETNPDLVLLDIKLRDNITGLDIAEYLNNIGTPFIFVSAFSNQNNYKKAVHLKPAKIFHKPVDHKSLLNAIDEVIDKNTSP